MASSAPTTKRDTTALAVALLAWLQHLLRVDALDIEDARAQVDVARSPLISAT
jgi:hypothetical protein